MILSYDHYLMFEYHMTYMYAVLSQLKNKKIRLDSTHSARFGAIKDITMMYFFTPFNSAGIT